MESEKISKKMSFGKIIKEFPDAVEILSESGMHCLGCPMAMQETFEEGCISHGIDADRMIKEINKRIENKKKK
jgi:hybrid cluster-associated redox disulfide protein